MRTTAFDVKDAMYDELIACADLAALVEEEAIQYGACVAPAGERPREVIWIGEIEWTGNQESSRSLGNLSRDEWYDILVTIESHDPEHSTQREANMVVKGLMQTIETLFQDPRWAAARGVQGLIECGIVPHMLAEGVDGPSSSRGAIFVLALHVHARKY